MLIYLPKSLGCFAVCFAIFFSCPFSVLFLKTQTQNSYGAENFSYFQKRHFKVHLGHIL